MTDGAERDPEHIVNERTGEQITFVVDTAELLKMSVVWTRPGHRAVRHAHPRMEERWEVVEGRAAFEVDGVLVEAGEGTRVTAPPGRPHLAWNPTEEPVALRIEMRPALRWVDFTRQLFTGEDPVRLLRDFSDEIVLATFPEEPQ